MNDVQAAPGAIAAIDAVPNILEVVRRTTGMGFAAIARVTRIAGSPARCATRLPSASRRGGELKVETTICDEIRDHGEPVIIAMSPGTRFIAAIRSPLCTVQSYISIPIRPANGDFFGTLCAIDPRPARLANPETIGIPPPLHLHHEAGVRLE